MWSNIRKKLAERLPENLRARKPGGTEAAGCRKACEGLLMMKRLL
jgi:hypothetical protein